jgi:hypothetical protein
MTFLSRLREFLAARAEHDAVADEMQFHVEREIQHNIDVGMSPADARRTAMRDFGGDGARCRLLRVLVGDERHEAAARGG